MKNILNYLFLSLFVFSSVHASEAQLFGIQMNKSIFQSIDKDVWLQSRCSNKDMYSTFVNKRQVPLYNELFPRVKVELKKCKVFSIWGTGGFYKRKRKCVKNISSLINTTSERMSKEYEASEVIKDNPFYDDRKLSRMVNLKKNNSEIILFGFCFEEARGYFMSYGLVDKNLIKHHREYKGKVDSETGL